MTCKRCNSTKITQASAVEKNTYNGSKYSVDIEYSNCGSCNREFMNKDQILSNERKVRDCKSIIDSAVLTGLSE